MNARYQKSLTFQLLFEQQSVFDGSLIDDRTSTNFAARDYTCPARLQGLRRSATDATGPYALGTSVTSAGGQRAGIFNECSHTVSHAFNEWLGFLSHIGIAMTYSNPGTLVIPAGLRVFPLKGHEITGWYVYRSMVDATLLEVAFAPELAGRSIDKTQIHEIGGFWMWTVNPHFDIRLAGNLAFLGEGYKDLAQLAICNGRWKDVPIGRQAAARAERHERYPVLGGPVE